MNTGTETNVPVEKKNNLPSNEIMHYGGDAVDQEDIKIPKILIMQPTSQFVTEGRFQGGDIVKSSSKEVIAKAGTPLEIIPLILFKNWNIEKKKGTKFVYHATEEMVPTTEELPAEWTQDGIEYRRNRALNFYVLFPHEIEREMLARKNAKEHGIMPDPNDALLPCLLTVKRTTYSIGKDLSTHFQKAKHFDVPAAVSIFSLTTRRETNDRGTYYVLDIATSGKTSPAHLKAAQEWCNTIKSVKVEVVADVELDVE